MTGLSPLRDSALFALNSGYGPFAPAACGRFYQIIGIASFPVSSEYLHTMKRCILAFVQVHIVFGSAGSASAPHGSCVGWQMPCSGSP